MNYIPPPPLPPALTPFPPRRNLSWALPVRLLSLEAFPAAPQQPRRPGKCRHSGSSAALCRAVQRAAAQSVTYLQINDVTSLQRW